jgi:hypothetical protein
VRAAEGACSREGFGYAVAALDDAATALPFAAFYYLSDRLAVGNVS